MAYRSLSLAGREAVPYGSRDPSRPECAPLLPLRGRARGSSPPACITSPPYGVLVMQCRFASHAPGRAGRPCLRLTNPLPGRFALRGGAAPPDALGSVGAATRLAAAYGHRLPRARLVPLGRERRRGQRAAWRLPRRDAAATGRGAMAAKYKTRPYTRSGGEGSIPRGHRKRAKRVTWARRRVAQLEARRGRV